MTSKILLPRVQKSSEIKNTMTASSDLLTRVTAGRKRKLDHLSQEQKVERKKLKNRVAAQTSRDRKKRQVEEMVETIEQQAKKITSLEKENRQLHAKYDKLEREFQKFKALTKQQDQKKQHSIPEEHKYTRTLNDEMTDRDISADFMRIKSDGSAVSNFKPLPKVSQMRLNSTVKSARNFPQQDKTKALLQLLILCLCYKKSLTSLSTSSLKKLTTFSKISTQSLREQLQTALMEMPRYKAINAHCLDDWWGSHNQQWNPVKIEA